MVCKDPSCALLKTADSVGMTPEAFSKLAGVSRKSVHTHLNVLKQIVLLRRLELGSGEASSPVSPNGQRSGFHGRFGADALRTVGEDQLERWSVSLRIAVQKPIYCDDFPGNLSDDSPATAEVVIGIVEEVPESSPTRYRFNPESEVSQALIRLDGAVNEAGASTE